MITEKKYFSTCCGLDFPNEINEQTLFFDIETTGFSPKTSHLYMIGCGYIKGSEFHTIQWFDDDKSSDGELALLNAFSEFTGAFKHCISFNGATFDFPYIQKKCAHYHLPDPLAHLNHTDIYKKIRPYKQFLGIPDLKQKSVEAFLGINRNDTFSGGQLISVYDTYIKTKDQTSFEQLMTHNYDDICGMIQLLPIMAYYQVFDGDFTYKSCTWHNTDLQLDFSLAHFIQIPIKKVLPLFDLWMSAYEMSLTIHGFDGILKYFYPNPKDYYYLPLEDTAIHKSLAAFVDKDFRQKATKENCYTKKNSCFLPQPKLMFSPDYREAAASKNYYFTWDTIENTPSDICDYAISLLHDAI